MVSGVRVLVVDDDQETLELLAQMLEQQGACYQLAASASAAVSILERYFPDIFLLDLEIPDEDGYSLISKIRTLSTSRRSPAIALTTCVRVEDRARALESGFDMFVPKPVESDELVASMLSLLMTSR